MEVFVKCDTILASTAPSTIARIRPEKMKPFSGDFKAGIHCIGIKTGHITHVLPCVAAIHALLYPHIVFVICKVMVIGVSHKYPAGINGEGMEND